MLPGAHGDNFMPRHYFPVLQCSCESSTWAGDLLSQDTADLHEAAVLTKH